MKLIVSWLGLTDIRVASSNSNSNSDLGPLAQTLSSIAFDKLVLLADRPDSEIRVYLKWLNNRISIDVQTEKIKLSSPTNFRDIFNGANGVLGSLTSQKSVSIDLYLHLSSGTPAMQSVWIILGRTKYPAILLQSSIEQGIQEVDIPFDLSAEYIPELSRAADKKLAKLSAAPSPESANFGDIIYRSKEMSRVVDMAKKIATRNIPVLIEGESGTGKELMARAIHNNSHRHNQPFKIINCGAIPAELVESVFFGHTKGSFTGAVSDRAGYFEDANNGTLFLDEIGELPLQAQVKLLRVLQEGEITRIGETDIRKVDVRLIAATNRNLGTEVGEGNFREDLFYRLAVATLYLPALRERKGDVGLIADTLLEQINQESNMEPEYIHKKLSASAKNLVINHLWKGNIRELQNTLRRAAIWSDNTKISEKELRESLIHVSDSHSQEDDILSRDISQGIDLAEIMEKVAKHYIQSALSETGNNKSKSAKLLGLPSYQTLTNWMKRYQIKE